MTTHGILVIGALIVATVALRHAQPLLGIAALFHNGAWIVSLALLQLDLVQYAPISIQTWFLVYTGIAGYNLGLWVVYVVAESRSGTVPTCRAGDDTHGVFHGSLGYLRPEPGALAHSGGIDIVTGQQPRTRQVPIARTTHPAEHNTSGGICGISLAIPLLFSFGFAMYIYAVAREFGLLDALRDPGILRTQSSRVASAFAVPFRLGYFLGPLVVVSVLFPQVSGIRRSAGARLGILIVTVVALGLSFGRTLLLVAILWSVALALLARGGWHKGASLRNIGFGLVVAVGAFQLIGSATGKTGRSDSRIQAYVHPSLERNEFTSAVVYLTGAIPALSELLSDSAATVGRPDGGRDEEWRPPALYLLLPLWKLLGLAAGGEEVASFVFVPIPFNVFTWLEPYYRDFGPIGVLVCPFLLGLVVAHLLMRGWAASGSGWRARSAGYRMLGALLLALTAWAPFVNKFVSTFTWEYVIILVVSMIIETRRRSQLDRWSGTRGA